MVNGGSTDAVDALVTGGYIVALPSAQPAPPIAAVTTAKANTHNAISAHTAMQRRAARALTDLLGPGAEVLALEIERAETDAELSAAIQKSTNGVRQIAGAAKADAYLKRLYE